jgi:hypothetical protein
LLTVVESTMRLSTLLVVEVVELMELLVTLRLST